MILGDYFLISRDKMPILFIFGYLKSMVARFVIVNQLSKNAGPTYIHNYRSIPGKYAAGFNH